MNHIEVCTFELKAKQIKMCIDSIFLCDTTTKSGKTYIRKCLDACAHNALSFVDVTRFSSECRQKNLCYANKREKSANIFFHPILKPEMCVM